jgi:L1 cell adhesion molecule like protein
LVDYFVKEFSQKHKADITGNARSLRRLRTACEKAKRALSSAVSAPLEIDSLFDGIDFYTTITRAKFEELCAKLFQKCLDTVKAVLKDAKVDKKLIDEVVLVGGSTRVPKVQKMLTDFLDGKELCKSVNPDEAVAYGAAIQAAILTGEKSNKLNAMVLLDVTPLSLGVETQGKVMSVVIPRNTTIPVRRTEPFTTTENNQTELTVNVFEGERTSTAGNNLLGSFTLTGILAARRGDPQIDISFDLDANGILRVTAKDKVTGKQNNITIQNNRGRLSDEQIREMIDEAEKNKVKDKEFQEKVHARNELEGYLFSLQSGISEVAAIKKEDRESVENVISEVLNWLDTESEQADKEDIEAKRRLVESIYNPVIARLYGKGK